MHNNNNIFYLIFFLFYNIRSKGKMQRKLKYQKIISLILLGFYLVEFIAFSFHSHSNYSDEIFFSDSKRNIFHDSYGFCFLNQIKNIAFEDYGTNALQKIFPSKIYSAPKIILEFCRKSNLGQNSLRAPPSDF